MRDVLLIGILYSGVHSWALREFLIVMLSCLPVKSEKWKFQARMQKKVDYREVNSK